VEPCRNLEQIVCAKRLCVLSAVVLLAVSFLILAGTWNEKGLSSMSCFCELHSSHVLIPCLIAVIAHSNVIAQGSGSWFITSYWDKIADVSLPDCASSSQYFNLFLDEK
jgi:hypothetical protein